MKKVLIANRGEIAIRIIRACQELGLSSVAVYSSADRDALHTKLADESICIGPGPSRKSYLSIPAIMSAVEISGVDAIHPGYGFLSENADFARICKDHKITFIGPKPEHIDSLGNKVKARTLAEKSGVPLLPGSRGVVNSEAEVIRIAKDIGFPLIIKAAGGGGGRGMKIVRQQSELLQQFHLAQTEAEVGFGNADVFVERYCQNPRHVEVQIMGDSHGNIVHLGERDCSIQRRYQKLVEESPCPIVDSKLREALGETALKIAKAVSYESLGTVEFLMEENKRFYFMEVNTRIQVEHPVTEQVTGIDLVKEQIRIAQGEKLSCLPLPRKSSGKNAEMGNSVPLNGHALECRINAEDPLTFAPWPGKVTAYHQPGGPGVRVDSMIYAGYTVPSIYDSLLAKVITFGSSRKESINRMKRALNEMKIDGIRTNIPFHLRLLDDDKFLRGDISTNFLNTFIQKT